MTSCPTAQVTVQEVILADWSCKHCRRIIGRYTARFLFLGPDVYVSELFRGYCKHCGQKVRWIPLPEKTTATETP